MKLEGKKIFITGGAGFIGSHIVDNLIEKNFVTVYDNLSTGREIFLEKHSNNPDFKLIIGDILDKERLTNSMKGHDFVFHFAANADIKGGIDDTYVDLQQNIVGTHNVLEAMKKFNIKYLTFASSAAVYGEPKQFPTPETEIPIQTSLYGASKLAAEGLIQAYGNYYDIQSWIFRFVSFMGERYTHGVIFDFCKKLNKNPKLLEILGDGNQKKSYLYVKDGVKGVLSCIEKSNELVNIFNLGHTEYCDVNFIAKKVIKTMGLKNVKTVYKGGIRGWKGDSPFVFLDSSKSFSCGMKIDHTIEETIDITIRYLLKNLFLLQRED